MKMKKFFKNEEAGISPFMAVFILLCWVIVIFLWAVLYSDVLQPWKVDSLANSSTSVWKTSFWTIIDYGALWITLGTMLYAYVRSQDEN